MSKKTHDRKRENGFRVRLRRELDLVFAFVFMAASAVCFALSHLHTGFQQAGFGLLSGGFVAITVHFFLMPRYIGKEVEHAVGQKIDERYSLLDNCTNLGLSMVYGDRQDIITGFWSKHVMEELEENSELVIAGTSLKGWETNSAKTVQLVKKAFDAKKPDLRILLVHPAFSRIRARQEGHWREDERCSIARDVRETSTRLIEAGIPAKCITFFKGAPTAFVIMTPKWLLFQPYPQLCESTNITMFTILAEKSNSNGIYEQIRDLIAHRPWDEDKEFFEVYDVNSNYESEGEESITI